MNKYATTIKPEDVLVVGSDKHPTFNPYDTIYAIQDSLEVCTDCGRKESLWFCLDNDGEKKASWCDYCETRKVNDNALVETTTQIRQLEDVLYTLYSGTLKGPYSKQILQEFESNLNLLKSTVIETGEAIKKYKEEEGESEFYRNL